ncbi:MAG: MSMEG_4193 family putative phosphomutase [Roseiflexaceae bacterium]|nr:MSMEG_4193 family putative phosphomutase [Roseiflexaceae bacterium]
MTTLLLIRHGANDWVHGRLAGRIPGVHLNDVGRQQAAAVSARLVNLPIEALYTSPLDRTVETAQAIAGPRSLPLRIVEGLQEVDYGEWQGAELKELYKHELWPGVQFYPSGTRFPNGETLGEAQNRMVATLDMLRGRHPNGMIAVVSHADIIKLAIAYYIGMHIDLFQRLEIGTCSVTALGFTRMGPRLMAFNEVGSLEHLRPKPEEKKEEPKEEPKAAGAVAEPQPATVPEIAASPNAEAPQIAPERVSEPQGAVQEPPVVSDNPSNGVVAGAHDGASAPTT